MMYITMSRLCRHISHRIYVRIAKPIMFRFSPDAVHERVIMLARTIGRTRPVRWLLRAMWQHQSPALAQTIHGLDFTNPVGVSAGFDKNAQAVPLLESIGLGYATVGSITGHACKGNDRPWFHRLPKEQSIVVNAGLPNVGSRAISQRLKADTLTASRGIPLVISVARTNSRKSSTDSEAITDYITALTRLRPFADAFELNISCPNTYGGEPFTTPGRLTKLLEAVDALGLAQPVFVKMPSNLPWSEFDKLLAVITTHHVAAVTIANLRKDRRGIEVDPGVKGNLSGKPTRARSDELIARTYSKYGRRLTIIGVGGIFTAEDAYAKITHGASLVGLVTGLIYEGPQVIGAINEGLEQLMKADGFTHISQAIGSAIK